MQAHMAVSPTMGQWLYLWQKQLMKSIAASKDPAIVSIPNIVRLAVVAVEPTTIAIVRDAEHVEVAIRVSNV